MRARVRCAFAFIRSLKTVRAFALTAFCVFFFTASCAFPAHAEKAQAVSVNRYDMTVRVLPSAQAINVDMTLTYTNRTDAPLTRLLFHVYGNCFRRESTLPYALDALDAAFPNGYAPGGVAFYTVQVNGEDADWGVMGEDESVLRVACALEPGETCVFSFGYMLLLSDNRAFLGSGEDDWRLIYFYPSACVYEYDDFTANAATIAGEFFYAECADFYVRLYVPEGYDVACGGVSRVDAQEDGYVAHDIQLLNAREFSAVISRKFHAYTEYAASGARVVSYGADRARAKRALSAAKRALDACEEWFGEYPYDTLSIARASVYTDALPLTGLIALGDEAYEGDLEYTVYRAVASEYFGVIAQPNMALEAWLDEALSEYTALMLTRKYAGENAFISELNARLRPALQYTIPGGLTPDSYTSRFASVYEYRTVTRLRGAAVLNELSRAMGRDALLGALGAYARAERFQIPSIADFAAALNAHTGGAWDEALVAWLYTISEYAGEILDYYD